MSTEPDRLPGFRAPPEANGDALNLQDVMPFIPDVVDEAVPLYISMGLLFVVISRAARRRMRNKVQEPPTATDLVQSNVVRIMGSNPRLGAHGGYWGDGEYREDRG